MKKILTASLYLVLVALIMVIGQHSKAEKTHSLVSNKSPQFLAKQPTQDRLAELSENTKSQLYSLIQEKQSRTLTQQKIDSQLIVATRMKLQKEVATGEATIETDVAYSADGRAEVDISGEATDKLLEMIREEGGEVVNSYPQFKAVRALLTLESLERIAGLNEVRFISRAAKAELHRAAPSEASQVRTPFSKRAGRVQEQLSEAFQQGVSTSAVTSTSGGIPAAAVAPTPQPKSRSMLTSPPSVVSSSISASAAPQVPSTGSVNSEGDVAHTANLARTSFSVTGAGLKIGVISDSVKFLSQSQANGELPTVTVLFGRSGVDGGDMDSGEGTAMLEIIHDLAPGAQLFFSTGKGGPAAFAQNILDLRAAGCNIIVDDLEYFNESPFQDAVVAQAVNTVTAAGALYFSSAGNSGNLNDSTSSVWEGDFVDGGPISYNGTLLGNAHRFFAPSIIFNQTFTNNSKGESAFLFWSDPLEGSGNDYDLYIVDASGEIVRFANNIQNGTQDPMENTSISDGEHVLIVRFSGANRYLHVNVGRGSFAFATAGRTKGHSAAVNAFSVAAVKARTSYPDPFEGGDTNPIETFSSDGPRRVFYTANGTPLTPGNLSSTGGSVRTKPDVAAADGVSTSVPGFGTFFGTSAAAPHAAAIAGLVLSFNPSLTAAQVRTALISTTLDIEATGPDRDSGAGIVMAQRAVRVFATCPATSISPGQTINGSLTTADCIFTGTTRRVDVYSFSGTAGQQISMSMSSSAFDTLLYLLDSDSNTLAQDDDGGGGTNSRIPTNTGFFTLPATGTYTIYATSFFEGNTGAYSLNLTSSNCTFSVNPTSQIFISSASTGSFAVSTAANCSWTATSNVSWLTTNSSGSGNGTVSFSVAANTGNSRTGSIIVQGQTFTVFQSAGNGNGCPSTTIAIGQTINANLDTGCVFTGTSRYVDPYNFTGTAGQRVIIGMTSSSFDTFLFLDSPNNQTIAQNDDGGGGTNSRIPANSGSFTLPTSGTYRIFATSFSSDGMTGSTGPYSISLISVTGCSYSISPANQSAPAAGGSNSFTITAPASCAWTALSNVTWITTSSSGSANGTINYSVAANAGTARTGSISVGGQLFTVNQSGTTPTATVQFASGGSTISETLNVTTKLGISVTRSGSTTQAASVVYATSDGSASQRSDYLATFGTLRFAAGEATKTITVFIVDDRFGESPETFNVNLSNPVGGTLGSPSAFTVTINSNESVNGLNPVKDASFNSDFFVREHYVDFFNREADASGLAFWKNQIDECTTQACREIRRINVSAAFFVSIEFQETGYLVYKAYQAAFNSGELLRLADFLPDTQEIGRGVVIGQPGADAQLEANKVAFFNDFVQRPAFVALANYPTTMTAAQFVDKLNANTFDPRNLGAGALTPSQRDALVAQLTPNPSSPTLRAQALRAVSENGLFSTRQFNKAFVLMQYFGYLRRNPNDPPEAGLDFGGYNFWLGKLNAFNGNYIAAEMVRAFIISGEYQQRFGP